MSGLIPPVLSPPFYSRNKTLPRRRKKEKEALPPHLSSIRIWAVRTECEVGEINDNWREREKEKRKLSLPFAWQIGILGGLGSVV